MYRTTKYLLCMILSFGLLGQANALIPHVGWFFDANFGYSRTFDKAPGPFVGPATGTVNNNGVGGSIGTGYRFNKYVAAEAGYTRYNDAMHVTAGGAFHSRNEHSAFHLAGKAIWPFENGASIFGKVGVGQARAVKAGPIAYGTADATNLYAGAGGAYDLNDFLQAVLQWAYSHGNNRTGSAALFSLGLSLAIG